MLAAVNGNTGMIPLLFCMLIAVNGNTGMIPLLFCVLIAVKENTGINATRGAMCAHPYAL